MELKTHEGAFIALLDAVQRSSYKVGSSPSLILRSYLRISISHLLL